MNDDNFFHDTEPQLNISFKQEVAKIYAVSRCFGIFPFDKTFKYSPRWNGVSLVALFVCASYEGYLWYFEPGQSPWVLTSVAWYFKVLSFPPLIFTLASHTFKLLWYREKLREVFDRLEEIESSLRGIKPFEYENASSDANILMILVVLKVTSLYNSQTWFSSEIELTLINIVEIAIRLICRIYLVVIQTQFTTILYIMQDHVEVMCQISEQGNKPSTKSIEKIIRLFNRLCTSCYFLNEAYSFQLLAIIAQDFININVNAFQIIHFISLAIKKKGDIPLGGLWLLPRVTGFIESSLTLFLLAKASASLTISSKNLNKILYRTAISGVNVELQNNEILLAHFSINRCPQFTACGLFFINYEMLYSVCASNATFIVMALQMFT